MKYDFPLIENISDVLPHIQDSPEFIVAERDGYTVINYQVVTPDTFPSTKVAGGSAKMRKERTLTAAIRRECRGIIFDSETGDIIRRPFHKFFNANENPETQANNIDFDAEHEILDKLDGSMIAPFKVNGRTIWGTKMGDTDVAQPVHEFVRRNGNYELLAKAAFSLGMTPIFEWCSRQQRIVLDYAEDQLILVALRDMKTGVYEDYGIMAEMGELYDIPVVSTNPKFDDMNKLIEFVRGIIDGEGFVVRFADGHMVKVKSDWYVAIHKAKEKILWDRNIVKMIIDNDLDDVRAHLPKEDQIRIDQFEVDFWKRVRAIELDLLVQYVDMVTKSRGDRKTFATQYADKLDPFFKQIMFRIWGQPNPVIDDVRPLIMDIVERHTGRNTAWDELRDKWFPGLRFNR